MAVMSNDSWIKFSSNFRAYLLHMLDPTVSWADDVELRESLKVSHKGLFVSIYTPKGDEVITEGILQEPLYNISSSADIVASNMHLELKAKNISLNTLKIATFAFCVVKDVIYTDSPLDFNENTEGVYFMWGQKYRGYYLPHQIKRMDYKKTEILDKLCSNIAGVPSNLWRLPCGLVFRIVCESYEG